MRISAGSSYVCSSDLALSGDHLLVAGVAPGDLLGLRLGGGHLRLERTDIGARTADLGVERITLGLGQIELPGQVAVLVLQLVELGIESCREGVCRYV